MLVIVDIDGTLADWKQRDVEAGGNPGRKDLAAYKSYVVTLMDDAKIINDRPVPGMQELVRALANREGVELVYLTGRSEKHRLVTARWLLLNRFPDADIIMRGSTDWSSAAAYKMHHVLKLKEKHSTILALEDESEVVEAMRRVGVTVLQVAYGEAVQTKAGSK